MKNYLANKYKNYERLKTEKSTAEALSGIYDVFKDFTMISREIFVENLTLAKTIAHIEGEVVECGVWRGGMIAGISMLLGKGRNYFLFDSFEGLPEPGEIDGKKALEWKQNKSGEFYFNNCTAEIEFAERAMIKAGVEFKCIKGWFDKTISSFNSINKIALLRLDADWYDSTIVCLKHLYPLVVHGGMIIIDDYYTWDGCSKAVHHYLAEINSTSRIYTSKKGVSFIIKKDNWNNNAL